MANQVTADGSDSTAPKSLLDSIVEVIELTEATIQEWAKLADTVSGLMESSKNPQGLAMVGDFAARAIESTKQSRAVTEELYRDVWIHLLRRAFGPDWQPSVN